MKHEFSSSGTSFLPILPNSRGQSYRTSVIVTITYSMEGIAVPNSKGISHSDITIKFGVEEMSLPKLRRLSHGHMIITSGVKEMPHHDLRELSHGNTTIICGVEEMLLCNSR